MRTLIAALMLSTLCGCATTSGAIPLGPDTYLITREAGTGLEGTTTIRNDALKEANTFCQKDGLKMRIVSMQEVPAGAFSYPRADVNFMCLKPNDPQLTRPVMAPAPNTVVEVRHQ